MAVDKNQLPNLNITKSYNTHLKVIQQLLLLGTSLDGLICDKEFSDHPALLGIKCLYNKRNSSPAELLNDQFFYLQQNHNGGFLFREMIIWDMISKFRWLSQVLIVKLLYSHLNACS